MKYCRLVVSPVSMPMIFLLLFVCMECIFCNENIPPMKILKQKGEPTTLISSSSSNNKNSKNGDRNNNKEYYNDDDANNNDDGTNMKIWMNEQQQEQKEQLELQRVIGSNALMHVERQFVIFLDPDNDPEFVCSEYEKFDTDNRYSCTCTDDATESDLIEETGKGMVISCTDNSLTCSDADCSIAYQQTTTSLLGGKNSIVQISICTEFMKSNFSKFGDLDPATTILPLNPENKTVCITVEPCTPGNTSTFCDCSSATLDGQACGTCKICNDHFGVDQTPSYQGITLDCCDVEPDFRSTCGRLGAGGAYVPFFDTVTNPGKCDLLSTAGRGVLTSTRTIGIGIVLSLLVSTIATLLFI